MNIPWEDVRLFLAVAETGSLSAAARKLDVTQPTASRRLADLEARLGDVLFTRGIDGARLTSFAEQLVAPATRMAEWAGEVERAAERRNTSPRGVVRITAPPGISFEVLAPFATQLRKKLPEVTLEVISSTAYLDLGRREADLALRIQKPTQPDLLTLASLEYGVAAFASKAYVASLPRGYVAADVHWIGWAPPFEHLAPNPQLSRLIPNFRPAFASDDFLVQLRAAEEGVGAIFLGKVRHRFLRETTLVELDVDLGAKLSASTHLVCAKSAIDIPRIRAVADLLIRELSQATTDRTKKKSPRIAPPTRGDRR